MEMNEEQLGQSSIFAVKGQTGAKIFVSSLPEQPMTPRPSSSSDAPDQQFSVQYYTEGTQTSLPAYTYSDSLRYIAETLKQLRDEIAEIRAILSTRQYLPESDTTPSHIGMGTDQLYTEGAALEHVEVDARKAADTVTNITYEDIAEYFLGLANEMGDLITNLRLQKLVYYAQAWHIAIFSMPLFDADFEAWPHGPVIPQLYEKYKVFGSRPIESKASLKKTLKKLDNETRDFLEELWEAYMPYNASALELMVQSEDPWIEARIECAPDEECHQTISRQSMKRYYGKKVENTT